MVVALPLFCAFNTRIEGKNLIFSQGIGGLNAAWNMCLLIWGDFLNERCGMLCSDSSVFYSLVITKFSVHHASLSILMSTPWGCDYPNGWGLVCGGIEQLCRPTGAVLEFGFNGYACDWTQWVVEQNYIQYFQRLYFKWKQFWLDQWTSRSFYLKCILWTNLHQFTLSQVDRGSISAFTRLVKSGPGRPK